MDLIQTNALTGQDISSPLLAATYTADQDRELLVAMSLSGLSGGGTYLACLTHQIGGAGSFHQSPTGQFALAAGVTTARIQTEALAVGDGDVVRVYVQGLTADVNAGVTVEVFDVTAATAGDAMALTSGERTTLAQSIGAYLTSLTAYLSAIAAAVWAYATRTLTAVTSGTGVTTTSGEANIRVFDYFSKSVTGLGDLSARTGSKVVFTVKRSEADADSAALIQVAEVGGLTVLNGAAYTTTTDGSITVTDAVTGALTIALLSAATAQLPTEGALYYDIKVVKASGLSSVLERGVCNILGTVTRRVT